VPILRSSPVKLLMHLLKSQVSLLNLQQQLPKMQPYLLYRERNPYSVSYTSADLR
jgi:hypothetical protein